MSEEFMVETDYSFAPQPHAMVADMSLGNGACRLWPIIHMLKWNKKDPDPTKLAELMGVDTRSIFRWLRELEQRGWVTWNRHHADPRMRLILRASTDAADAAKLGQIRVLFASGVPTLEQIRHVIEALPAAEIPSDEDESPDGSSDPGGAQHAVVMQTTNGESDSGITSDSRVGSVLQSRKCTPESEVTLESHVYTRIT